MEKIQYVIAYCFLPGRLYLRSPNFYVVSVIYRDQCAHKHGAFEVFVSVRVDLRMLVAMLKESLSRSSRK